MCSPVKDVIVDAGGKARDTAASPPRLFSPPSARETRPWGGGAQILTLKRSHTAATSHVASFPYVCQLFFWYINLRVCGISTQEDRTLVGDYQLSEGGWRTRGKGGRVGVYSALASGASSRVVRPSGDCSSLWWCLASYNLQNAHPFAEVWWMGGGGGGVEWKGRGMADYSDTYRKGGSGVSWVNKKKKAQHWGHVLVISTGSLYLKEVIMCFLGSYVVIWSVISFAFKRSAKWKKTKVNAKGS